MDKIYEYFNGNGLVSIYDDGTRIIDYENVFKPTMPLNIDIRISNKCSFGFNNKTNKTFCTFCHESATTNGLECNYDNLKSKLNNLPEGIELAIGCNELTESLYEFLKWAKNKNYICNLTINQGHINRDEKLLLSAIKDDIIKGLGISYRSNLKFNIPKWILDYSNTVFHVIAGIDNFKDIEELSKKGVKKILILGEKNFGFNQGNVDLTTRTHKEWFWWIHELFNKFKIVSFDNLALEQLNLKRFLSDDNWEIFNQNEFSFYINAVDKYYAPSSRSNDIINWNDLTIGEYFKTRIINE